MSSGRDYGGLPWRVAVLCFLVTLSVTSSSGQQMTTYVCQTPAFWCVFQWTPGVANGFPCYCTTLFGPFQGYSIDPGSVTNAPKLPEPQQQPQTPERTPRPPAPRSGGEVAADDCYKGLGNCQGSFMRAARDVGTAERTALTRSPRTFTGTLAEGASRRISLSLKRDVSYTITGECNSDCDDLDLKLFRSGTVVDDDTDSDAMPLVSVSPSTAGLYSLEVIMESCSEERCSYTIEVEED